MHIDILELENIILGHDFNVIVTNLLECLNRHSNNWKARNYFVHWAENKCLVHVFRFMNPDSRKYTWSKRIINLVASGLDMFWMSNHFCS